jgi:hypothetical protein
MSTYTIVLVSCRIYFKFSSLVSTSTFCTYWSVSRSRVELHLYSTYVQVHHAKQNQQNIAAALVGWHDDATEEPKMVKNGSDEIEDD